MMNNYRSALVIAHPGHELRVHAWLAQARPLTFILTDGSGRTSGSRLGGSTKILQAAGGRPGGIYGRMPDRHLYDRILNQDRRLFQCLAQELADGFVRERIEMVVGDAEEGEVMAHDLWRAVRMAAVGMAESQSGHPIRHYEFVIDGAPRSQMASRPALVSTLDADSLNRKLQAARDYWQVSDFVWQAVQRYGVTAFGEEVLYAVHPADCLTEISSIPAYERHGQQLVKAGVYPQTIRFDQHLRPIMESLRSLSRAA